MVSGIYHRYGRLIAAYAVTVPEPDAWLAWAEQLRDASELAEPDLCPDDIECTVSDVVEALRQLDQAELVCALCQLEADKVPGCAAAEQLSPQSSATDLLCSLPSAVAALQEDLDECVAWLHENPETFLLASYYIQTVIAGLRPDLEDVYHLVETVWKFEPLVEMLGHAEGVSIPAGVSETLRCAIEQAVRQHRGAKSACAGEASSAPVTYIAAQTPTTRLSTSDTRRLATFEAFPREELTSLLAAASDQAHNPRFLRWRSPDRQYEAVLVIQPTHATLNFYRATGQHAEELIDTPICLAGVTMRIGPPGRVLFDPTQLAQGNQPVYLEVGPERQRWRPDPAGQTPEPASK